MIAPGAPPPRHGLRPESGPFNGIPLLLYRPTDLQTTMTSSSDARAWVAKLRAVEAKHRGIGDFDGASERLQGCIAGPSRPQRCSGAQRAAVREREGAWRRRWPALPLPGRRA